MVPVCGVLLLLPDRGQIDFDAFVHVLHSGSMGMIQELIVEDCMKKWREAI